MPSNKQQQLQGVADLSKLNNKKRDKLQKLFREYNTEISYSKSDLKNKETQAKDLSIESDELYSAVSRYSKLLEYRKRNASYKYLDSDKKTDYFTSISQKPEIKEVMTKLCNELIVTRENSSVFAEVKLRDLVLKELGFKDDVIDKVSESIKLNSVDFIKKLGLNRDGAWKVMYQFLKEGKKAWEIVYDNPDNPKRIKHFVEVDAYSLEEFYDNGQRMWIHTPKSLSDIQNTNSFMSNTFLQTDLNKKKILYDHQIMIIDWSTDVGDSSNVSYMEGLIKPYNMMRIMDETRIIWAVTNSTYRTLYSIPTQNQGRNRSEQTVNNTMEMYKDHYNFDTDSGDVSVNGSTNLQMAKDIFLSKGDSGDPDISVLGGDGFDLQNIEPNLFFQKKFYRSTMMPYGRFDSSSQESWNIDATSIYREEIDFDRFKGKIHDIFSKILIKPVSYQLVLDYPELHAEPDIPENIYVDYSTNSIFGKIKEQEMLKHQFEFVEQIRNSLAVDIGEGETIPYMPIEYVLKKYLDFSEDDIKQIEKMRLEEIKKNLQMEKSIKKERKKMGISLDDDDYEEE